MAGDILRGSPNDASLPRGRRGIETGPLGPRGLHFRITHGRKTQSLSPSLCPCFPFQGPLSEPEQGSRPPAPLPSCPSGARTGAREHRDTQPHVAHALRPAGARGCAHRPRLTRGWLEDPILQTRKWGPRQQLVVIGPRPQTQRAHLQPGATRTSRSPVTRRPLHGHGRRQPRASDGRAASRGDAAGTAVRQRSAARSPAVNTNPNRGPCGALPAP